MKVNLRSINSAAERDNLRKMQKRNLRNSISRPKTALNGNGAQSDTSSIVTYSSMATSKLSKRHLKALEAQHQAMRIFEPSKRKTSEKGSDRKKQRPVTSNAGGSVYKMRQKIKAEITKQLDEMDKAELEKIK